MKRLFPFITLLILSIFSTGAIIKESKQGESIDFYTNPSGTILKSLSLGSDGALDFTINNQSLDWTAGYGGLTATSGLRFQLDSDNDSIGETFGIYKDSATLGGGTELFHVKEDGEGYFLGNVGIGTDSPDTLGITGKSVDIYSTSDTSNLILSSAKADADNSALGKIVAVNYTNDTNYQDVGMIRFETDGTTANKRGAAAVFYTAPDNSSSLTERMRIDSSGNVGIGTNEPAAKQTIYQTTSGDFQAFQITQSDLGITTSDGFTIVQDATGNIVVNQREASKFIDFRMAGDSALFIDGSNNLGLNTTPKSWSNLYNAVQLAGGSAWWSHVDGTGSASTFLGQNAYLSATGWKSIVNNEASYFQMKDGAFYFNNDTSVSGADETLTPTSILEITSSGNSILTSTDAGATVGPVIDLYRDSASPNYDDVIGAIRFSGEDSTSAKQEYASIEATIEQHTSKHGQLDFYVAQSGNKLHVLSIDGSNSGNFDFQGRSLNNVGGGQIPVSAITGGGRGLTSHIGTFSMEHSGGSTTITLTGMAWSACTQGCFLILTGAQPQGKDVHYAEWVSGFLYFNGAGSHGTGAPIRSYSTRDDTNFGCTYSFSLIDVPYTSVGSAPQISVTPVLTGTTCNQQPYTVFTIHVYRLVG